jgi:hypothetical protein
MYPSAALRSFRAADFCSLRKRAGLLGQIRTARYTGLCITIASGPCSMTLNPNRS